MDENKTAAGVCALIIALIICGIFAFTYRGESHARVTQLTWTRKINIDEWRTVHDEDWNVPPAGRETSRWRAIHHYEDVYVGSHQECDTHNKCKTVDDYDSEPVYKTKYAYDIERWVTIDTKVRTANDKSPVWPTVEDLRELGTGVIGTQRAGTRTSIYTVYFLGEKDKRYALDMTEQRWTRFEVGDKCTLILNIFGAALDVR